MSLDTNTRSVSFALLLAIGCASGAAEEPPHPQDYDDSCATVDDCRAVVWEAFDCGCSCPSVVALSATAAPAFEADQQAYKPEPCDSHCDMGCVDAAADHAVIDCVAEVCQVVDGPYSSYY